MITYPGALEFVEVLGLIRLSIMPMGGANPGCK